MSDNNPLFEPDIKKRLTEMGMDLSDITKKPKGKQIGTLFGMPVIESDEPFVKGTGEILKVLPFRLIDGIWIEPLDD